MRIKVNNVENLSHGWDHCYDKPGHVIHSLQNLSVRRMWTSSELWTRETPSAELKGQFWWKFRKPNSRYNGGSEGLSPEVSEGNKDFISRGLNVTHVTIWQRIWVYYLHVLKF